MKLFKHKRLFIIILIALLLLFGAKAYYDTNCIEVKHYQIKNLSLGEVLGGLKVAHLSDLHIRAMGAKENKMLELLKEEKPDLIFITGDFISFKGPYEPGMSFLRQLKPPYGIYGVLGNTEYSNENGSCVLCHEERSKKLKKDQHPVILRNSFFPLKINGKTLNILGVDDPVDKKSNLKATLRDINFEEPSILLAHSPEIFEEASGSGIDLLLCGHTHGGQIFLTKYLRKIIPLESSLEFIEGLFQNGKMLMYVNRGVGTSYLPFRFGVKPEITFFKFPNDTNEKIRMSRITQIDQIGEINETKHIEQTSEVSTVAISNSPPYTLFLGFSISSILETFDFVGVIRNSFASTNSSNSSILFDFESEDELKRLNWQCHKWFEVSKNHATSGKYSLKVLLPPGQYPGISFKEIRNDWSEFRYLKMDAFNPSEEEFNFHVRIDDNKSGVEYANRFDADFNLKPGINNISIPTSSIQTNLRHRSLNLKGIKGMMIFLTNNTKPRELYLDNIRLE